MTKSLFLSAEKYILSQMDRINTYQKAKADQDQELREAIDKFVRGETVTCPSLDEWSMKVRELKAEHFDQVLKQAEDQYNILRVLTELKVKVARLKKELNQTQDEIARS